MSGELRERARQAWIEKRATDGEERVEKKRKQDAEDAYALKMALLGCLGIEASPTDGTCKVDGMEFALHMDSNARFGAPPILTLVKRCDVCGRPTAYLNEPRIFSLASLGEALEHFTPQVRCIQCTVLGPRPKGRRSLLGWLIGL